MSRSVEPLNVQVKSRRRRDGRPFLARKESKACPRWVRPDVKRITWAAGVFDGEGCAFVYGKNRVSPCVTVGQKDWWLPFELRTYFGGRVHYKPGQEYYVWQIHGARAIGFLMTIYQFLSPRRQKRIEEILFAWKA